MLETVSLQHLAEAPCPGEGKCVLIQDHASCRAKAASQSLVERRFPPIAIANLLLKVPLVVAEEAYPVPECEILLVTGTFGFGVLLNGLDKVHEGSAPKSG